MQVVHVAGTNRDATSAVASQDAFSTAGSAKAVVLAQDGDFPDALAGGPLATAVGGPLLLNPPGQLAPATLAEIQRVLPSGGTVYVLGGTSALSTAVSDAITAAGYNVQRLAGTNRFGTAVAIANLVKPTTIFEATGLNFPDALAAGSAAALDHAAILLSNAGSQSPETLAYLQANPTDVVYAIGGPAAHADPAATGIVGTDRFATATAVAQKFFTGVKAIGLVSGLDFPDAMSAVPLLAALDAPMILVNPTGALPSSVSSFLTASSASIVGVVAFGGTSALGSSVISEVTGLLSSTGGSTTGGSTTTTTGGSTTGGSTTTTTGGSTTTTTGGSTTTTTTGGLGGLSSLLGTLGL